MQNVVQSLTSLFITTSCFCIAQPVSERELSDSSEKSVQKRSRTTQTNKFTYSKSPKGTEDSRMDSPGSENSEISREHTPQPAVTSAASSSQSTRQSDVQETHPPLSTVAGQWGTFPSAAFGGVQGQPQFWPWPFMTYGGPPCFAPMPPTQGPSTIVRAGPPDDLKSSNTVQHPLVMGAMPGLPFQQYVSPPQCGRPVGHKVTRGLYSRSGTTPM